MPVILDPADYGAWLREGEAPRDEMSALLKPFPPGEMEAFPISTLVNNPRHDSPECIEPLAAG
jgi:putative SOS response-associated peptidase YedK